MTTVGIPPQMVPLVDSSGRIRQEWYRFFARVDLKSGGATGIGVPDLDAAAFAPMQPATGELLLSDISQPATASGDVAGDVLQGFSAECCVADVMQPDDSTIYYIEA